MSFRLLKSMAKKISRRELNYSLSEFIIGIPSGAKVLNIGAGGEVMNVINSNLKYENIKVTATDIDAKRNPDIIDDIAASNLLKDSYDYIIIAEVLEHVSEPKIAVTNMYKTLRKGGKIFISTPYIFPTHDAPFDYYRYTEFGLRYLLSDFKILDLKGKTTWWETILLLAWRTMWVSDNKTKSIIWILTVLALPILFLLAVFSSKNVNLAYTAGFIVIVEK